MRIIDNNFRIELKEGDIKEYEKVILSEINDIFMPMGFVSFDEGELVTYNCSGYSSLSQCDITEVLEALEILERTLILVSRASEYLISPNRITLNKETIFYDRNSHQVRIAYVPVEKDKSTLRENMTCFITEIKENLQEQGRLYMDKVKTQIEENNYYIQDLVNIIGDIRRAAVNEVQTKETVPV
jgi:hypothetical protein